MTDRLTSLVNIAENEDFDAVLLKDAADIFYLTGVKAEGYLIITGSKCKLYIPSVSFFEAAEKITEDIECVLLDSEKIMDEINSELADKKTSVEFRVFSKKEYERIISKEGFSLNQAPFLAQMRIKKDERELLIMKKAAEAATEILNELDIKQFIGKSEKELAGELIRHSYLKADGPSFEPVVASGINSAYPHHRPESDIIKEGWVKIDFGVCYNGYCSDLTRTFILDKFFKNIDSYKNYNYLKYAQQKAVSLLRPGVKCCDVHKEVQNYLETVGLKEHFIHGLGHGIGIDVHEGPVISEKSNDILDVGMIVTIEPGFYIPGTGGMRLEDVYYITNEGSEQLTSQYQ